MFHFVTKKFFVFSRPSIQKGLNWWSAEHILERFTKLGSETSIFKTEKNIVHSLLSALFKKNPESNYSHQFFQSLNVKFNNFKSVLLSIPQI